MNEMNFSSTISCDEIVLTIASEEVGRFTVYKGEVTSMGIFVEEKERGLGFARRMMNGMLEEWALRGRYDKELILYIDTDASNGFWDHIGMHSNPKFENETVPQYGYEKCISVSQLDYYLNGI
jgi:GNAT superfamily N-acetyltransferase